MKGLRFLAFFLLVPSAAFAQYEDWNATEIKPTSCLFNWHEYYVGDVVCVRPGIRQTCLPDGSLGAPAADASCKAVEAGRPTFSAWHNREGIGLCTLNRTRYSIGAEICTAEGTKQTCQADGTLSAPAAESTCKIRSP